MTKYIIGAIVFILLALGGGYYLSHRQPASLQHTQETSVSQAVATSTYATSTYSVVYPSDFSVNDAYAYDQFGKKLIHGVKFTIPLSMATGTNLSSDTGISIEQLPRAKNCTADIYIPANVKPQPWSEGTVQYSMASTSGAAAGNLYEEDVYALSESHPCTAVRYFIHSSNIGNYTPGTVREFDHAALLTALDAIRRSIVLKQ